MKNVVTPETARKLKEKGFPQPENPTPGEVWYIDNAPYVVRGNPQQFKPNSWIFSGLLERVQAGMDCLPEAVFAPTATDILSDLGNDYHIGMLDGVFVSGLHQFGQSDMQFNDNPSEAAALVWLEKHAK